MKNENKNMKNIEKTSVLLSNISSLANAVLENEKLKILNEKEIKKLEQFLDFLIRINYETKDMKYKKR